MKRTMRGSGCSALGWIRRSIFRRSEAKFPVSPFFVPRDGFGLLGVLRRSFAEGLSDGTVNL